MGGFNCKTAESTQPFGRDGNNPCITWAKKRVNSMIKSKQVAPFSKPLEEATKEYSEECPICFYYFNNGMNICSKCKYKICSECYFSIGSGYNTSCCPQCSATPFKVSYKGRMSKEEIIKRERENSQVCELEKKIEEEKKEEERKKLEEKKMKESKMKNFLQKQKEQMEFFEKNKIVSSDNDDIINEKENKEEIKDDDDDDNDNDNDEDNQVMEEYLEYIPEEARSRKMSIREMEELMLEKALRLSMSVSSNSANEFNELEGILDVAMNNEEKQEEPEIYENQEKPQKKKVLDLPPVPVLRKKRLSEKAREEENKIEIKEEDEEKEVEEDEEDEENIVEKEVKKKMLKLLEDEVNGLKEKLKEEEEEEIRKVDSPTSPTENSKEMEEEEEEEVSMIEIKVEEKEEEAVPKVNDDDESINEKEDDNSDESDDDFIILETEREVEVEEIDDILERELGRIEENFEKEQKECNNSTNNEDVPDHFSDGNEMEQVEGNKEVHKNIIKMDSEEDINIEEDKILKELNDKKEDDTEKKEDSPKEKKLIIDLRDRDLVFKNMRRDSTNKKKNRYKKKKKKMMEEEEKKKELFVEKDDSTEGVPL